MALRICLSEGQTRTCSWYSISIPVPPSDIATCGRCCVASRCPSAPSTSSGTPRWASRGTPSPTRPCSAPPVCSLTYISIYWLYALLHVWLLDCFICWLFTTSSSGVRSASRGTRSQIRPCSAPRVRLLLFLYPCIAVWITLSILH